MSSYNFQNQVLRSIIFIILFIALFHLIALNFYLYDEFWWTDVVAHFLGGAWIALLGLFFVFFSCCFKHDIKANKFSFFTISLFITLVVGSLWEVFEFNVGLTFFSAKYWPDTISDIIFDLLGAIVATIYFSNLYRKSIISNK